jgi:uncharacterized damage-inducible protein DinB
MNRQVSAPGAALGRIEIKLREDFAMSERISMRTIRIGSVACTLAIVAAVSVAPSNAQPASETPQAALTKEAGTLSDKFSGLARVMAGKYDWKPGEGVRSVGEVFNFIVVENGILGGTLTGAGGGRGAPITDPEKMQAALKTSYANLQKTIQGLSDSDLKVPVKLFGREMTKESAIRFIFGDQHEHLGQSIAYARTNGVIPPWSK